MSPRAGASGGYRRLRGVDRMYLALESAVTPMHFGALVVLDGATLLDADGRLDLADLRGRLAARIGALPELRRMVRGAGPLAGGPIWIEDPAFRIEHHVDEVRLPPAPPGDGESALFAFLEGRLLGLPLDRRHPLWRVWFITGLPGQRVGVLVVIHHALADGLEAMRLARTLLETPTSGTALAPLMRPSGPPPPIWRELVIDRWRSIPAAMASALRPSMWRGFLDAVRAFRVGMAATRGERASPLNAMVGRRRRLAVLRLDLARVKAIARANDAGANDVVLGLVAGGVRALLAARGEPIERLAPRVGIAVGLPPSSRRGAGNHFGSYVVPLPLAEADPPARLRRVAAARERAKASQSATQVTGIRAWTARFPPTRALMARQRYIQVMETYVPGPPRPITLLGAPVVDLIPIQPLGRNVGLTFLASSYAGCVTIAVRADPDAFPDLDVALSAIAADWETIATTPPT